MSLAPDITRITIDNTTFVLRPSLGLAIRLERKFGGKGFMPILEALKSGSFSAVTLILEETGTSTDVLDYMPTHGLAQVLPNVCATLIIFLVDLVNVKPDEPETDTVIALPSEELVPFGTFFEILYGYGTGHLGWTPSQTYDASAYEIMVAYRAKIAQIKMIFGSSETSDKGHDQAYDASPLDLAGLNSLRNMNTIGGRV